MFLTNEDAYSTIIIFHIACFEDRPQSLKVCGTNPPNKNISIPSENNNYFLRYKSKLW